MFKSSILSNLTGTLIVGKVIPAVLLVLALVAVQTIPLVAQIKPKDDGDKYHHRKCADFINTDFSGNHSLRFNTCKKQINSVSFFQYLYPADNGSSYLHFSSGPEHKKNKNTSINWNAFSITSGVLAGVYTGLYQYGERIRWDVPRVPFYIKNDFDPRGIDKLGHFYATKTQGSVISNLYGFSGLNKKNAALLGAGIALSIQSLVEIKDGTISGGGFDVFDQIANTLGAGWFYSRENVAFLKRFNVRWFYYPSKDRDLLPPDPQISEDYNGHTYWLSMRIWDLLPQSAQSYWPRFIVPAAGISLNNWSVDPNQNGELSYHLSLNLDFKHILPQQSKFTRALTEFLNGFYIPAPALEVYPRPGLKLIFFGQN